MRKFMVLLLLPACVILSCSNDDDTSQNEEIVGEWKLMRATQFGITEESIDYSADNISYTFQANGTLSVQGGDNLGYAIGEYDYVLEDGFLSGSPSPEEEMLPLVKIGSTKWIFEKAQVQMSMKSSYIDGPDLFFEQN